MIKDHPRTGESHDLANPFPHNRLVAVNPAVGTKGLRLHERTLIASLTAIRRKLRTFGAQTAFCMMLLLTIDSNHL